MQYITLGKTGLQVSRLGFGCMRLPMKTQSEVDRDLAIPMLHRGVELGITYFDTAVGYCAGDSQRVLGEAMEGMRDKIIISTKNHHYDKNDKKGWWKNLEDSLERIRTDHIDIYNFHGMNYEQYESRLDGDDGLYREVLKAKEQGMVRHICHSFHGTLESLKKCVDTGMFEVVTLQYNLLDQSLEEGIAYASEHGMGVVVMGPVGGGRLGFPSGKAQEIAGEVKSTPELALRFVLSNQNVSLALSGMSTVQQLDENVETVSNLGELSAEDHTRIEAAVEERKKLAGLYCTGCNYCLPCPDAVDIPANFEILNLDRVFGLSDHAKSRYATVGGKAALCRQCGTCVELCPQDLDIPTRLGEAVALLDDRSGSVAGWGELRGAAHGEDGLVKVDMRYHIKNFTENQYGEVKVDLHGHGEEQVAPSEFAIGNLKSFGRRHKDIQLLLQPPVGPLSIDSLISFDGSHTVEHLYHIVAEARKDGEAFQKGIRPDGVLHVPGPIHPVHATDGGSMNHGFDFAASYDSESLLLWAEVADDLAYPLKERTGRMQADCLRICLDGRKSGELGLGGGNVDGVMYATVYPQPGDQPFVNPSNDVEIKTIFEFTDTGYVVRCAIPWSAFNQQENLPGIIGFDCILVSYDSEGKQVVRMSWSGREGQEQDTSHFGKLLMV